MKLNLIVIRTISIEKLAEMYEKLGIKFHYHQHGNGPFHYSADLDGLIFEIYSQKDEQEQIESTIRLGFDVDNLDELIQELQNDKIRIRKMPKRYDWGYVGIIEDLDGRVIELKQKELLKIG